MLFVSPGNEIIAQTFCAVEKLAMLHSTEYLHNQKLQTTICSIMFITSSYVQKNYWMLVHIKKLMLRLLLQLVCNFF